jgi:hypothetical protein
VTSDLDDTLESALLSLERATATVIELPIIGCVKIDMPVVLLDGGIYAAAARRSRVGFMVGSDDETINAAAEKAVKDLEITHALRVYAYRSLVITEDSIDTRSDRFAVVVQGFTKK